MPARALFAPASAPLFYRLRLGRAVAPVALVHARTSPTHERLERHATGRHPTMSVVTAESVAVRPGTLVDGEPADPVTRTHHEVFSFLALLVNDPPRHARPLCLTAKSSVPWPEFCTRRYTCRHFVPSSDAPASRV